MAVSPLEMGSHADAEASWSFWVWYKRRSLLVVRHAYRQGSKPRRPFRPKRGAAFLASMIFSCLRRSGTRIHRWVLRTLRIRSIPLGAEARAGEDRNHHDNKATYTSHHRRLLLFPPEEGGYGAQEEPPSHKRASERNPRQKLVGVGDSGEVRGA